ncbi:transcription elongation factor GreA [Acidipropionibacterium timonense]|uniref:transcription elongation factor GreA n=1 Tax=Acidipropionibacterium timonense TaxID=2161818 RepID=UPI001030FB7F|nr:transcription elongation factor GreA [Acidipropionibacterium timonense]
MSESNNTVWLTQEAFDKLQSELTYLKGEGRTAIANKIAEARSEGDLSENGGYHAAREEQGQAEARIRQLEHMLREAKVGQAPAGTDEVVPGSKVTVAYFDDEDDTDTFLLGSREVMGTDDAVDIEVYSPQSPLGAAVQGHRKGEKVSYQAPTGKTIEVTILAVEAFHE